MWIALAEIPVTGSPEAEFGRSSGATVNIVTKERQPIGSTAAHLNISATDQ